MDSVTMYDLKIGNGTERALGDRVRCLWLWGQEEKVSVARQCGVGLAINNVMFCFIIIRFIDVEKLVMKYTRIPKDRTLLDPTKPAPT